MTRRTVITVACGALAVSLGLGLLLFPRVDPGPAPATTAAAEAAQRAATLAGQLSRSGRAEDAETQRTAVAATRTTGGRISGVVVDVADGPVADAVITCRRTRDTVQVLGEGSFHEQAVEPLGETTSRPDGQFELEIGPVRAVVLEATHPRFAPKQLILEVGEICRCRIVLEHGGEIFGRVTRAESGVTVDTATVAMNRIRAVAGIPSAAAVVGKVSVRVDGAGRCRATGLAPGSYKVRASVADGAFAKPIAVTVEQGDSVECNLAVGAAGPHLRGTVVDDTDGSPLAGARVWSPGLDTRVVTTGQDGRFELSTIAGRVQCECAGFALLETVVRAGAEPRADLTIRLSREARIEGRLVPIGTVDLSRATVAAMSVRRGADQSFRYRGTVHAQGRFVIAGLDPRRSHWVVAKGPGAGQALHYVASVRDAVNDIGELGLGSAALVAGRVTGGDGQPVLSHLVLTEVRDDGPDMVGKYPTSLFLRERLTSVDGTFCFADLGPGTYSLRVAAANAESKIVTVGPLHWNDTATADVCFEGSDEIGGVVTGPLAGEPLYIGVISEQNGVSVDMPRPTDAAQPRFSLSGLAGGSYAVVAEYRGAAARWICGRATGIEAGTRDVALQCRPIVRLSGRVVDADGAPQPGVEVFAKIELVENVWYRSPLARTTADGAFTVSVAKGDVVDLAFASPARGHLLMPRVRAGTANLICVLR